MDGHLLSVLILLISILVLACLAGTLLMLSAQSAQMAKLTASQRAALERLPPPGAVARLQQEIRAGVSSQRNAVTRLPDEITVTADRIDPLVRQVEELASRSTEAIGMLSQELAMSHRHFQAAVTTLSEPRHLQDWAETLRGAVRPLQGVEESIRRHEECNRQILGCLQEMGVQGQATLRSISLVQASMQQISEAASCLVTSTDRLLSTGERSACLQRSLLESQNHVAAAQERTMRDLERRQTELGAALEELTTRVSIALRAMEDQLSATVLRCSQLLQETHQRHMELIGQATQSQAKNQRAFLDALTRNHALWESAAQSLHRLPTVEQGNALVRLVLIMIGIQGVTALAVIACAIQAFAPGR